MANPEKTSPVAEQLKDLMTSDTTPVALKCAKVALGNVDTAGGILSWQNPEAGAIMVVRLVTGQPSPRGPAPQISAPPGMGQPARIT